MKYLAMDCDFTEEVSLLVDGELTPHAAERLGAHIEVCAACRQARESFLLLRRELRSYDPAPDLNVQRAALSAILDAPATPRGKVSSLLESLAEAFRFRSLRPAHVAALVLLLTGIGLGLLWLKGSRTSRQAANALANANGLSVQTVPTFEARRPDDRHDLDPPAVNQTKKTTPHRASLKPHTNRRDGRGSAGRNREGLSRELPQETARVEEPLPSFFTASAVAAYAADDPTFRLGRHAERVERLLRSFRNARLTKDDPTLEVTEARQLSKRLLYSNIALRREAESAGDLPAEGLLDSVEPILIDISNLPDAPSPAAIGSIKERIKRRRLVGALQAQGMMVSR